MRARRSLRVDPKKKGKGCSLRILFLSVGKTTTKGKLKSLVSQYLGLLLSFFFIFSSLSSLSFVSLPKFRHSLLLPWSRIDFQKTGRQGRPAAATTHPLWLELFQLPYDRPVNEATGPVCGCATYLPSPSCDFALHASLPAFAFALRGVRERGCWGAGSKRLAS